MKHPISHCARAPLVLLGALAALAAAQAFAAESPAGETSPIIVMHGGAGALEPGRYTAEQEAAYKAKLAEALNAGYAVLDKGGAAVDAVETALVIMEDSPLFNAGKGAVFTREGTNELDAAIMDGATMNAGAVAGVKVVKNPIKLARAVMDKSRHVMFARDGAEAFAREQGLEIVDPGYFRTEMRWKQYQDALAREKREGSLPKPFKYGTVGAVALDRNGHLAAGTSTGGLTLKEWGRVGDSPIIGAGTYASDRSCAVSGTGDGEYFMRLTIARDVCAQVEYGGKTLEAAAKDMIHSKLPALGGEGGVIALAPDGEWTFQFNTPGMFRGMKSADKMMTAIYGAKDQ